MKEPLRYHAGSFTCSLIRLQRASLVGLQGKPEVVRQRLVVANHQLRARPFWVCDRASRRRSPSHGQGGLDTECLWRNPYSYTERKRIRKSFGKRESVLNVPYLLTMQKGTAMSPSCRRT